MQQGETKFHNMSMFSLSNTILMMDVRANKSVFNATAAKKGAKGLNSPPQSV